MPGFVEKQIGVIEHKRKARLARQHQCEEQSEPDSKADRFSRSDFLPAFFVHAALTVLNRELESSRNPQTGMSAQRRSAGFPACEFWHLSRCRFRAVQFGDARTVLRCSRICGLDALPA